MSDATIAVAARDTSVAASSTAADAADGAAESVVVALAHRNAAQAAKTDAETARDDAQDAASTAAADALAAVTPANDVSMTAVDNNAASAFRVQQDARLSATYVREGAAFADLGKQTGVDNTGTTECAAALNTALNGFLALGVRAYAKGTFKIASTVTIKGNADLGDATFNYTGATGTAVVIGSTTSGDEIFDITVHAPKVVATAKTVTGWAQVAGTIGVDISNLYQSTVALKPIRNFETNLRVYGKGTGCVYNTIYVGHLDNGKINQLLSADATGWSNQNTYIGGRWAHESAEGTNVAGTRQIEMAVTTNGVNNNTWLNPSLEGNVAEFTAIVAGGYNIIDNGRWEVTGGAKVKWASNAIGNEIRGGYQAASIVQTWTAGASRNRVRSIDSEWFTGSGVAALAGSGAAGGLILENQTSGANPAFWIMDAGAQAAGATPRTAYCFAVAGQSLRGKRASDAEDRIKLDFVNGRVYIGSGAATPTQYLSRSGTALAFNGTHVDFLADNTYDLGETGAKPRYIRAGTGVQTGAFATGSRPAAATAGAGAMVFDTTLGKPIWSTGSAWVDATGATV